LNRCPASTHSSRDGARDFDKRNRFLNYRRDQNTPKHNIKWNFIVEAPFGKGKKFWAIPAV
jgi:hypothetical protein